MQLVQEKRWNHLVDPYVPWTMQKRLLVIQRHWPLFLLIAVLAFERLAVEAWLRDYFSWTRTAGFTALIMGFIAAIYEIHGQLNARAKRRIKCEKKGLRISPSVNKINLIKWQWIRSWWFSPVAEQPGITRLTLTLSIGKVFKKWTIILDGEAARKEAIDFARSKTNFTQDAQPDWQIEESKVPEPQRAFPKSSVPGLWMMALAIWLMIHGLPLALAGAGGSSPSKSRHEVSAEKAKIIAAFAMHNFGSREKFKMTLFATGLSICVSGAGFYGAGLRKMKVASDIEA